MVVIEIDPLRPQAQAIAQAIDILRQGGLVAFPTETVYGLGANALDSAAVARIFSAKGRPSYNPLIVHVADVANARRYVTDWPESAARLAAAFWPGPLTLVLPKQPAIVEGVTAGLFTVAIRIPAHPVALALLRAAGLPVAAPSANRFTELSPTTAAHVARSLGDRVDLILDGGPTAVGIESTVLDLSGPQPVLLRPGILSREQLTAVLGHEILLPSGADLGVAARPSPGMIDRHYAPQAVLYLFNVAMRNTIMKRIVTEVAIGRQIGALLFNPLSAPIQHAMMMPAEPTAYARLLYAALHSLDDLGCDLIFVEDVPDTPAWTGIRDRLLRAAQ
jgi:L-threonylcarbamoyladenylate synthase